MLHEGLYNRLYIWPMGAVQWSLNDTRGSWGGLQCHIRGRAIQALGVLFNDHWVVLEGPGVVFNGP